jgi:hypothetical protein
MQAASELQGNLLGDFLDAVEPALMDQALKWVGAARIEIRKRRRRAEALNLRQTLTTPKPAPSDRVWEKGWGQAREVRRVLGLSNGRATGPSCWP